ncbi:unnamed protein product, partial [Adineta ricciae]
MEFERSNILKKCIIICWNPNTNGSQTTTEISLNSLFDLVKDIKIFHCIDQCIDFVSDVSEEQICLALCAHNVESLLPLIHDIPQIQSIFIKSENGSNEGLKMNRWTKFKGSFTDIADFCNQFKTNLRKSEHDFASVNFAYSLTNDHQRILDASFMYSQLLKDILLSKEYDDGAKKDFINYLRQQDANQPSRLKDLDVYERNEPPLSSIWWYTKAVLFYDRVNKALRTQDTDTIVHMGVYIQELHREIGKLHKEQQFGRKLRVYRGQLMRVDDFEKLQKNKSGLLSFNNFLSTSKNNEVLLPYADSSYLPDDSVGISFHIEIDPAISSIPFADIHNLSQHKDEEEILFSMHTIFHIDEIIQKSAKSWQVNLTLTDDNDPVLKQVTDYMREQIRIGSIDKSLVYLLIRMGKYNDAEN